MNKNLIINQLIKTLQMPLKQLVEKIDSKLLDQTIDENNDIVIGQGQVWYDPGYKYGYEYESYFLRISYDDKSIQLLEFDGASISNTIGVSGLDGCRRNYAPSDFYDEYVDARIESWNKKEFYWVINNIIDIIKEFKKSKEDLIMHGPTYIDEGGEQWKIILDIEDGDLSIIRWHRRGLSQMYIHGKINIQYKFLNNLKEQMFKVKRQIN